MLKYDKKGFTLIEMLVVIAVIGLLASIIVLGLGPARSRARDARRIADLKQIQNLLETQYTNVAGYNAALPTGVPKDPSVSTMDYYYEPCGAGSQGYVLGAEVENAPTAGYPATPSGCAPTTFSCGSSIAIVSGRDGTYCVGVGL